MWWVASNKDRLIAEGKESMAEATTFAASHDQNACVDEGLRKAAQCDGLMCETNVRVFTQACIQQAAPTPGFCDGVPKHNEIVKTTSWVMEECRRRGKPSHQRCTRLLQAVPQACNEPKGP